MSANTKYSIEDGTDADLDAVLELNEQAVPAVNSIDMAGLESLRAMARHFHVVRDGSQIAGFLLAFVEGADYHSDNYRWFTERYPRFMYVDRVVIAPAARGSGIGRLLYDHLEEAARRHGDVLCCEVNVRPANPRSMRFHEGAGFSTVGQQDTEAGAKRVALMAKAL